MEIELTTEMVKGIRRCRHELNLNQEEFALRYETTGATICRLESGNQGRIKKKLWELMKKDVIPHMAPATPSAIVVRTNDDVQAVPAEKALTIICNQVTITLHVTNGSGVGIDIQTEKK